MPIAAAAESSSTEPTSRARKQLTAYLGLTFAVSFAIQGRILLLGGPIETHGLEILALMWTPGLVSILCRLLFREGFTDASFAIGRAGGAKPWLVAWLFPVVVGGIAYGGAWLSGMETFEAPPPTGIGSALGFASLPEVPRFFAALGLTLFVGPPLAAITATGEEIGWRGYMLTRLIDAKVKRPLLVSGLVWGSWHVPLILSGQYAAGPYPALSAAMFMCCIVSGSFIAGYVRLETGSVWAAALFHAAWNAIIQGPFDRYTQGGGASTTTSIWIGESGILVALVSIALAIIVIPQEMDAQRSPKSEPERMSLR